MDISPLLVIPYLVSPPVIDGRLEPEVWNHAAQVTGFLHTTGNIASRQSSVLAGFDDEHLYLAFVSFNESGGQANVKERDNAAVFTDDAIEVYLQPDPASGTYFLLGGNALGTQYDAKGQDGSWNAEWKLGCERDYDSYFVAATWTAEIAIPFRSFGLDGAPPDGTEWRGNFCRDWTAGLSPDDAAAGLRYTTWAPIGGSYHTPERFGTLVFRRGAPAVRLDSVGDLARGAISLEGEIRAATESNVNLSWAARPIDGAKEVASGQSKVDLAGGASSPFHLEGNLQVPGTEPWPAVLDFSVAGDGGGLLYRQAISFKAIPAFRAEVDPVYLEGFAAANFDVSRVPDLPADAVGRVKLIAAEDRIVAQAVCDELGQRKVANVRLDISGVDPGDYQLKVALEDGSGSEIASRTEPFHVPPPPPWHNNRLGISDRVPPPFTDVVASERSVDVWGRTYTLGDLALPERIDILGTELLAGPVRLVFADGREDQEWRDAECRLADHDATQAQFEFTAENDTVKIRGSLRAEYDGFLLYDLDLEPLEGEVSIGQLSLEIPLHRKLTPFLRASRVPIDRWAAPEKIQHALIGDLKADVVPEGFSPGYSPHGWKWGEEFIPQFWAGNDFQGIFFYMETPEQMNWEGSPLEVVERGDQTLLRFNFINRQTNLDHSLHYQFALQATPVRKRGRRMERLLFGYPFYWKSEMIEHQDTADGKIPGAVLWEFGRIEKDYRVTDPDRMRRMTANWQSNGVELLVNIGSGFFVEDEKEFQQYGPEWTQQPPVRYPNHAGTDVTLVKVCPRSSFPDYFLWWMKEMIEKYDIGGIYLDLSGPVGCTNPHHGCGFERDGKRHMTAEQFACREFYKRCYTFLKEEGAKRGREFFIFQHSAEGIVTTFVDMMTKGEGWSSADTFDTLTPTYFRACESWSHLGVPYTFYPTVSMPGYRGGKYRAPHREPLACTLLHDVLTVGHWKEQIEGDLIPIWKAWDEFEIDGAEWVPYYQEDPRVAASKEGLLASFYIGPGRLMIVASNLTREPIDGELKIDRAALGLPAGKLHVREILSGDQQVLDSDVLPVQVDAKNLRVLRIN